MVAKEPNELFSSATRSREESTLYHRVEDEAPSRFRIERTLLLINHLAYRHFRAASSSPTDDDEVNLGQPSSGNSQRAR